MRGPGFRIGTNATNAVECIQLHPLDSVLNNFSIRSDVLATTIRLTVSIIGVYSGIIKQQRVPHQARNFLINMAEDMAEAHAHHGIYTRSELATCDAGSSDASRI